MINRFSSLTHSSNLNTKAKPTLSLTHLIKGKIDIMKTQELPQISTPKRKRRTRMTADDDNNIASIVTPSSTMTSNSSSDEEQDVVIKKKPSKACRQLSMPSVVEAVSFNESESSEVPEYSEDESEATQTPSKRHRQYFGRNLSNDSCATVLSRTRKMYALIKKRTGSIGGNGHGGAIYGELTIGSMQKMVDLMKLHTNLGPSSRFIDVGSGLGKPNIHVAQDPAVEFSYGIEMERVRWILGMSNLEVCLEEAKDQQESGEEKEECIKHKCTFAHGDITEASYFDPFTHVYMFDIGFPPKLFRQLGEMFNRSQSEWLICYHGPKLMIDRYGFNVELIVQTPTSMHGSSEGHMGYIYRRAGPKKKPGKGLTKIDGIPCDPLFKDAWISTKRDVATHYEDVKDTVANSLNSERPRRVRRAVKKYQ